MFGLMLTDVIRPTTIRIPHTRIEIPLTALNKKILAVALATLVLFGLQLGFSLALTLGATVLCTTLTYLSEKYLRKEENDWFNTKFDKKEMLFWTLLLILKPIIIQIVFFALGIPLPVMPQVELVQRILARPWFMIPMATIIAPIAEEILFRGFLLEQFENLTQTKTLANVMQSLVFAGAHRSKVQAPWQIPVFLALSLLGYAFGKIKQDDKSLISPVAIHSANNIGSVIHIFIAQQK